LFSLATHKIDPQLRDFRNFLFLVWKHLGLPTPAQYALAYRLQHGSRRDVIQAFRGIGKSWITVAYVLWRLYLEPELKVLVVSASKSLSDNFSTFCFQLISTMPLLSPLLPRDDCPWQRWSKIQFDVGPARESKDPSVRSVGITGQITGGRADLIVADDIETANNSMTQKERDKLAEAIKEFDAVLKPGGKVVYLGTPQTELSVYNVLPARGYEFFVFPARYPTEERAKRYQGCLAPSLVTAMEKGEATAGDPTDPLRFGDTDLLEREASYGRSGFALQFMLDTNLSDMERYPLKLSDLIVMDVNAELAPEKLVWANDPRNAWGDELRCIGLEGDRYVRPLQIVGGWIPYTGSVLAIDPAGRGTDELGYCVMKQLNGNLYVTALGGLMGGYNEANLKTLAKLAKDQKVNHVVIESNFGDGMFTALFKPVLQKENYPVGVEEVRHSKQKELRIIDTLEPLMNQHRIIVDAGAIRADIASVERYESDNRLQYTLAHQLTRITKEKGALGHDDRLDVLAIAAAYWVEAMAQNDDEKVADKKAEDLDRELEKFMENALGPNWNAQANGLGAWHNLRK
jgi:hypothetical protein